MIAIRSIGDRWTGWVSNSAARWMGGPLISRPPSVDRIGFFFPLFPSNDQRSALPRCNLANKEDKLAKLIVEIEESSRSVLIRMNYCPLDRDEWFPRRSITLPLHLWIICSPTCCHAHCIGLLYMFIVHNPPTPILPPPPHSPLPSHSPLQSCSAILRSFTPSTLLLS